MASVTISAKVNQAISPADYDVDPARSAAAVSTATVDADVATLVADGATPTQDHVNTLNTDWAALKTLVDALPPGPAGNVTLVFDGAAITTKNQLKAALREIMLQVEGGAGGLT